MNKLMMFENQEIEIITVNDEVLFELYSVGMALGQTVTAKGRLYPNKKRIDNNIKNAEISTVLHNAKQYLTEENLYDFMLEARTEKCKTFRKWVTHEVLPTIRKSGCYITENAKDEAVDYQKLYGSRKIRKTFLETKNLNEEYERYKELTKIEIENKRITTQDRIKQLKIISETLEYYISENATKVRASKILEAREIFADVLKDKSELHNRRNGGIKAHQTKRIKKLEEELGQVNKTNNIDFYYIPNHAFSENYMYEPIETEFGIKTKKTNAYKTWIKHLDLSNLPKELPFSLDSKVAIHLRYAAKDGFDNTNLSKAIQDQIANNYNIDDRIFTSLTSEIIEIVDTYEDGYILVGFTEE